MGNTGTVQQIAMAMWGVRPRDAVTRFSLPGWSYRQQVPWPCPTCASPLHTMNKPNETSASPRFHVAVVCRRCPDSFTLAMLGVKASRELLQPPRPTAGTRPISARPTAAAAGPPPVSAQETAGRARRADIARFWRSVELFITQKLDPVDPKQRQFNIRGPRDIPWHPGHRLSQLKFDDDRVWRHTVYGGMFTLDQMYDTLKTVFGPSDENFDERAPRGLSAVFAARVTQDGRLLLDSLVITTAAWAAGRALNPGPDANGWLDGFEQTADSINATIRAMAAAAQDDQVAIELAKKGIAVSRPIGLDELQDILDLVVRRLGVRDALRPGGLRTHSDRVGTRKAHDAQSDLLNSFFLDDLQRVAAAAAAGDVGPAVLAYLSEEQKAMSLPRCDVRDLDQRDVVLQHLAPVRAPAGRWPAKATHPLATSQQFAINAITDQLGETGGMFAVNGPPGTGKTTMLRDLIAAVVVNRAHCLAELRSPTAAFTAEDLGWTTDTGRRRIRPLVARLTGFEMVVASANNGAVANVVKEVPQVKAIDEAWAGQVDYFAEHASRVLDEPAWALIAAPLGRKRLREEFTNRFWWSHPQDPETPDVPPYQGFLDWLKAVEGTPSRWPEGVAAFRAALAAEQQLRDARQQAHTALLDVPVLQHDLDAAEREMATASAECDHATTAAGHAAQWAADAQHHDAAARQRRAEHLTAKPGILEILFTFGRAIRRWHAEDEPLVAATTAAYAAACAATQHAQATHRYAQDLAARLSTAVARRDKVQRLLGAARRCVDEAYQACGEHVPDDTWHSDDYRREVAGPWLDGQWNAARTRVFLTALELHAAFIAATAPIMRGNLHAMMDILSGKAPNGLPEATLRAAWQSLFLVVPVVSTTFSSVHRLFGALGRESLGWLLIDEAGQAAPQAAIGAIWRSRRVVAVGDPLQLDPIVGVLHTTQAKLLKHHDVTETWLPGRTSVQACADRITTLGTWLPGPDDVNVWVGAPLRVHRRCDNPMFDVINNAVYHGLMIRAVVPLSEPLQVTPSAWIDIPGADAQGNWIPEETDAARRTLEHLQKKGVDAGSIMVISPFRDTAYQIKKLPEDLCDIERSGTIHTAQGKEADIVLLVLGGNPAKPGSRRWAASRPNLFNVAVSRAKQRLYVIGDHASWSELPYFSTLARELKAPRPMKQLPTPDTDTR